MADDDYADGAGVAGDGKARLMRHATVSSTAQASRAAHDWPASEWPSPGSFVFVQFQERDLRAPQRNDGPRIGQISGSRVFQAWKSSLQ